MNHKPYRPSNGTEGDSFISTWCANCIHGKYEHDQTADSCEIVANTMCHYTTDPEYPKEWCYDSNGNPQCTAFVKWDWGRDDDGNWNDPPKPEPEDPNQLVMPFIIEDVPLKKKQLQNI